MKLRSAISIVLVSALLAGIAVAAAEKQVSDDLLYDQVRRKLASDQEVKGGAIDVDVKAGVVTLRGSVELDKQKTRAEKLVKKIGGVKQGVNELQVRRPGAK